MFIEWASALQAQGHIHKTYIKTYTFWMISYNIAQKIVSSQKLSWSCLSFLFASLLLTFDDLARDGLRNPTVFHGSSNLAPYTVNISRYGCLYAIHATCVSQCTWHLRAWQWNAFVAATSAIDWAHMSISMNPHLQYTESTSAMHWTPILYAQARRNARKRLNK